MVRPNCSRTLAYSTAISRAAQLTPTASADARIRNTVRALRAAPRSTRSPSTVTPRSATDPTLRVVSRESSAVIVTPSARASTMTTSSPAAITSTSASGAASTAGLSPVTTRSEPIVTLPDRAERTDRAPVGQSRKQLRANGIGCAAVDHHRRRDGGQERARATVRGLGPRAPPPIRRGRIRNHRAPRRAPTRSIRGPCPPTRFPTDARSRSPASRAPPRGCSAGSSCPIAASARSGCSSVMARADLLTVEVLRA